MLEDAFACFEAEVQAVEIRITLFKQVDHAQALQVVLETTMRLHTVVQSVLPRVAESGVAQVVGQSDRLDQVFVDGQGAGNGPGELRHLERMRQAGAKE